MEIISLTPAEIGAELRATSRCIEVENKELTFECEVYEGERQVAAAMIKRATVERVSFLARTAAQSLINQSLFNSQLNCFTYAFFVAQKISAISSIFEISLSATATS